MGDFVSRRIAAATLKIVKAEKVGDKYQACLYDGPKKLGHTDATYDTEGAAITAGRTIMGIEQRKAAPAPKPIPKPAAE